MLGLTRDPAMLVCTRPVIARLLLLLVLLAGPALARRQTAAVQRTTDGIVTVGTPRLVRGGFRLTYRAQPITHRSIDRSCAIPPRLDRGRESHGANCPHC